MRPALTAPGVLYRVQELRRQTILFASLASSAFLIYLDPQHSTHSIRTLLLSQLTAALVGLLLYLALGGGFVSAGTAMVVTVLAMIPPDAVHPPAVSAAVLFALRAGNVLLFGLARAIVAVLVLYERLMVGVIGANDAAITSRAGTRALPKAAKLAAAGGYFMRVRAA